MTEKIQKLIALIVELNPQDEAHFTAEGVPSAFVLKDQLGENVSAAERDEAFTAFKYQHPITAANQLQALNPEGAQPGKAAANKKPDLKGATSVVTMRGGTARRVWYRAGKEIHVD